MKEKQNILNNWDKSIFDKFIKFNSKTEATPINNQIPPQASTFILFENEGVIVVIDQNEGFFEFYTTDEQLITYGSLPTVEEGRKSYLDICYSVDKDNIVLKFPVYQWIDNYPNCDGESDRWDTKTIGFHIIKFDFVNKSVKLNLFK
ncbi:MAG: hypothetical protein E7388_01440 [Ruminococcaceae bacterium]|nr:hypothetical protein [Oscillospiraceae bacterium]